MSIVNLYHHNQQHQPVIIAASTKHISCARHSATFLFNLHNKCRLTPLSLFFRGRDSGWELRKFKWLVQNHRANVLRSGFHPRSAGIQMQYFPQDNPTLLFHSGSILQENSGTLSPRVFSDEAMESGLHVSASITDWLSANSRAFPALPSGSTSSRAILWRVAGAS